MEIVWSEEHVAKVKSSFHEASKIGSNRQTFSQSIDIITLAAKYLYGMLTIMQLDLLRFHLFIDIPN